MVVGAGPGSFTGVRIAGAAAKGLASGLGVPLYAASSLQAASFAVEAFAGDPQALEDAIADAGLGADADGDRGAIAGRGDDREVRYVLFDARNGRVYGACYDVDANGPTEVAAPHGGTILEVLNGRPPLGTCFMGDGAVAHAALIHAAGYEITAAPCRDRHRGCGGEVLPLGAGGCRRLAARLREGMETRMTERISVRRAMRSDLAAIRRIEESSFSRPWKGETFDELLGAPGMDVLVAVAGAEVAGYAVLATRKREAELANLAVSGSHRGEGIGRALLSARARGLPGSGRAEGPVGGAGLQPGSDPSVSAARVQGHRQSRFLLRGSLGRRLHHGARPAQGKLTGGSRFPASG